MFFFDFWIFGFLDFWLFESLDFWIFGFLDFWTGPNFGFLDFWTVSRPRALVPLGPVALEPTVSGAYGHMGSRGRGS